MSAGSQPQPHFTVGPDGQITQLAPVASQPTSWASQLGPDPWSYLRPEHAAAVATWQIQLGQLRPEAGPALEALLAANPLDARLPELVEACNAAVM